MANKKSLEETVVDCISEAEINPDIKIKQVSSSDEIESERLTAHFAVKLKVMYDALGEVLNLAKELDGIDPDFLDEVIANAIVSPNYPKHWHKSEGDINWFHISTKLLDVYKFAKAISQSIKLLRK